MVTKERYARVLSIDPCSDGFGFAVLEGGVRLVDWGLAQLFSKNGTEFLIRVKEYIDRYKPVLIVTEYVEFSAKRMRAWSCMNGLIDMGRKRQIRVECVSRKTVREAFGGRNAFKQEIAEQLAEEFPELLRYTPKKRETWMAEDRRMNMFDALSYIIALRSARSPDDPIEA